MPLSHSTFQHTPTIAVTHLTRSLQPSPPWLCLPLCSDGPSSPPPLALLSLTHQLALSLWLLQNGFYRLVYELVRLDHAVVTLTHRSQWLHTHLLFGRSLCFQVWVIILSGSSPHPQWPAWKGRWRLHRPVIVSSTTLGSPGPCGRWREYWECHAGSEMYCYLHS